MNSRIKEIRRSLNLSQSEFGERINLSQNYIWMIEKGDRTPSDRTISDISREFNINESWLRTGEGEMMRPVSRDEEISSFMGDVMRGESDDFRRRLVAVLSKLDASEWELLEKMALKLADECKKGD